MRLEGSLDAFSLPDIFQLLSFTKKTGGLHLHRAGVHGVVHFTTGSVTGGNPDLAVQSLVRRLAGAGLLDDDAISAADGRTGIDAARAMLDAAGVDEARMREIAAEAAVDTVFDLLRWPDGDFSFMVDEENPLDTALAIAVDDILAEARRRLELWQAAAAVVPGPDAVLAMPLVREGELSLTGDEWGVLALVDGQRTVTDLVSLTGRGQFAVVTALAGMVERGLLVVGDTADDGIQKILARHHRLSTIESVGVAPDQMTAQPSFAPEPVDAPPAPSFEAPVEEMPAPAPSTVSEPLVEEYVAGPEPVGARAEAISAAHEPVGIIPARPEPFLARRRPEHPDDGGHTTVTQVIGSTAVAAETVPSNGSLIERDPSVNKSLLLRLIAGVRGL